MSKVNADAMNGKQVLLANLTKIHTTKLGIARIKKNLNLDTDNVVAFCKNKISAKGYKNKLYSYDTLVAEIKDGKPVVYGTYSQP